MLNVKEVNTVVGSAKAVDGEVLEQEAKRLYAKLSEVGYEMEDCLDLAPITLEINTLKKEMDALVLCHHFMTADLIHGVADIVGDASMMVDVAKESDKNTFIVCAITPLAEAIKLVRPDAVVLSPNLDAGCSIADGIDAQQLRELRKQHPGVPAIAYINSSAEVKAESDYVVTSGNVRPLLERLKDKKVLFYPDRSIATNLQEEFPEKEIVFWDGRCVVHEEYTAERLIHFKEMNPNAHVLLHSECTPDAIAHGHMHGGTAAMMRYVEDHPEVEEFFIVTECGLADTLRVKHKEQKFIGTCALCPYMKAINLHNTLSIMKGEVCNGKEIIIEDEVLKGAQRAMDNMYSVVGDIDTSVSLEMDGCA